MAFRNRSLLAVSAALAPILALVAACSGSSGQGNGSAADGSSPIVSLSGPGPGTVPSSSAPMTTTITALMAAGSAWGLSRRLAEYR